MEAEVEAIDPAARLDEILSAFEAHGAPGADSLTTYLFELTGEPSGRYLLTLSPEGTSLTPDHAGGADVTIRLATADFIAMADGEMDGRFAVSSERIEIEGDLALAAKMLDLVDPDVTEE